MNATLTLWAGFVGLLFAVFTPSFAPAAPPPVLKGPEDGTLELHAHLFMKHGMGPLFRGDFFGPLHATSYRNKLSSQANPESLDASGISLAVVALYANPILTRSLRGAIREQIKQARRFVSEHPGWIIAHEPDEARAAIILGKRVLVFSLEGASGILETEEDLREFVDEGGIRIVTLLHLTDDAWGGAAFLRGLHVLANPLAWLSRPFSGESRRNSRGLSARGESKMDALIKRKLWIDLAHASDHSIAAMLPHLEKAAQPLLVSHTALRKFHGAERGVTDELLVRVRASGGLVGLVPSPEFLANTMGLEGACALAHQWGETVAALGDARAVALGSDWNGGLTHLAGPTATCVSGTSIDGPKGLWNIGQSGDLWRALKARGAPLPRRLDETVAHFLAAWDRVRSTDGRPPESRPKDPSNSHQSRN